MRDRGTHKYVCRTATEKQEALDRAREAEEAAAAAAVAAAREEKIRMMKMCPPLPEIL